MGKLDRQETSIKNLEYEKIMLEEANRKLKEDMTKMEESVKIIREENSQNFEDSAIEAEAALLDRQETTKKKLE
ncbi:hypothetical protein JTB14_004086 [Gonioctena quinquepunctata]|nr:hypothetical protein JTB14_004086 [Gonioctena quinquepunctata]